MSGSPPRRVIDPTGTVHSSIAAAARAHGVAHSAIRAWLQAKPGWQYEDEPEDDNDGALVASVETIERPPVGPNDGRYWL